MFHVKHWWQRHIQDILLIIYRNRSVIIDYVPQKRLPRTRKVFMWALKGGTLLVAVGLYEFETNDVGLTEAIKRIWRAWLSCYYISSAGIKNLNYNSWLAHLWFIVIFHWSALLLGLLESSIPQMLPIIIYDLLLGILGHFQVISIDMRLRWKRNRNICNQASKSRGTASQ